MPLDWPTSEGVTVPALAAGRRLPIVEEAETSETLGQLRHVDTAGLTEQPLRNAAALNRSVDDAWADGNLQGYRARLVRCVAFQTGVADYQAASQVARGQALRLVERGEGAARTVEHLLPEWRMIADAIGVDEVRRLVRECIDAVADDLVPDGQRGTMVGLLKAICHRYGRPVFEETTKVKYTTLDRRVTSGNVGTFKDNFGAVVAMLRLEERLEAARAHGDAPATEPPAEKDLAEYWEHAWVKGARDAWMAEVTKQLKPEKLPNGKRVMLCEKLKMLAGFSGEHQHEAALRTTFKIPATVARALAGNEVIDETHVQTILDKLVQEKRIPGAVAGAFLDEWRATVAETAETAEEPLGARLRAALDAKNIDNHGVALALRIRDRRPEEVSPVSLVKDSIDETRVNDAVSMYTVSCLARATTEEVDADMRRFIAELKARPKVNGRTFTSEWSFMTQFALRPDDLEERFREPAGKIQQYAGHGTAASSGLITPIIQTGWRRAAEAVERWLKYHEPATVKDAATDLHEKVGAAKLLANVKASPKTTLPNMQAGTEVLTLPMLRQLVADGGAVVGNALLQDWYVRRAELADAGAPSHLSRALDVFGASRSTSMTGYLEAQSATVTGAGAIDTVRKTALKLAAGKGVSDGPFENVLKMAGVDAPNDPTGLFLRSLRGAALPQALDAYCRRLAEADRMDVLQLLLRARQDLQPKPDEDLPPTARLQAAMKKKEAVVARRAGGAQEQPGAVLQVLTLAPGLLPKDLLAWQPQLGTPAVAKSVTPTPAATPLSVKEKPAAKETGGTVVREAEADPDDALRTQVFDALYQRVAPEYRQFWDGLVKDAKLNEMFAYHVKKKNTRDAAALERVMWTSLHIAIRKTERR